MNNINLQAANNTGVYSGNITITLKHGTKTFDVVKAHNAGTKEFFSYILNCIKGYNDYNNRPGYIYVYSDNDFAIKSINTPILYSDVSEPVGVDGISSANTLDAASMTYSFLIPDTLISGKTIKGLQLVSLADKQVYAEVILEVPIIANANTNVEIDWKLNLSNI